MRTWIPILDSWNICDESSEMKELNNRTNNGPEQYNRHFNSLFKGKPSLIEFVTIVEKESRNQACRLDDICNNNIDERKKLPVTSEHS